jgi:hypothetical protein
MKAQFFEHSLWRFSERQDLLIRNVGPRRSCQHAGGWRPERRIISWVVFDESYRAGRRNP